MRSPSSELSWGRNKDDSTTQKLVVELEGPLAAILGSLLRRPILSAISQENAGFKTAAETN